MGHLPDLGPRYIERVREIDPGVVGDRRVLLKKVKRLHQKIARKAGRNPKSAEALKPLYIRLFELVGNILQWSDDIAGSLASRIAAHRYGPVVAASLESCLQELQHFHALGTGVLDQAYRRIIQEESVPNPEEIFSLFEPHTELLKRGKADKPIEFGHIIQIQQVEAK